MKDQLSINDQIFCAVRAAAAEVSYSKDYITRLAREHKIRAVRIGRNWYVDITALKQYVEVQALEDQVRSHHLKEQRKIEHGFSQALLANTATSPRTQLRLHIYAFASVCVVVVLGVAVGSSLNQVSLLAASQSADVAKIAPITAESGVLIPIFTTTPEVVTVAGDRQILKPTTQTDWLRIRYE